jgi:hypothetical protein
MHDFLSANDFATKRSAYALMAQTNAEYGQLASKVL